MNRIESWAAVAAIVGALLAVNWQTQGRLNSLSKDTQGRLNSLSRDISDVKAEVAGIKGEMKGINAQIAQIAQTNQVALAAAVGLKDSQGETFLARGETLREMLQEMLKELKSKELKSG